MLLSIVIPCHGRQETLAALIGQILAQRAGREDVEIIVVDDASAPPIAVPTGSGVALRRLAQRSGAPAARRLGFETARGAYVHFHDSDDLLGHGWLDAMRAAIARRPEADLIVTSRLTLERDGAVGFWSADRLRRAAQRPATLRRRQRFVNRIGPLGGVTFSRRAAQALRFHPCRASQDWLMYDDALSVCAHIRPEPGTYFVFDRRGSARISRNPMSRARGYVFAARRRFAAPWLRRLAARLYCAHGAAEMAPRFTVRRRWFKRALCELFARAPLPGENGRWR